jgi:hypothetical protein
MSSEGGAHTYGCFNVVCHGLTTALHCLACMNVMLVLGISSTTHNTLQLCGGHLCECSYTLSPFSATGHSAENEGLSTL